MSTPTVMRHDLHQAAIDAYDASMALIRDDVLGAARRALADIVGHDETPIHWDHDINAPLAPVEGDTRALVFIPAAGRRAWNLVEWFDVIEEIPGGTRTVKRVHTLAEGIRSLRDLGAELAGRAEPDIYTRSGILAEKFRIHWQPPASTSAYPKRRPGRRP